MSRRDVWRDGEVKVISVTPVSRGVVRPVLFTATTIAIIIEAAGRYAMVHRFEDWLVLIFIGPLGLVTITRIWRWRSHKVHVTNDRVIIEGGVLRHQRTSIELSEVMATRVDQRVSERLTRRGYVYLETYAGSIALGLVRHPGALCRLIDAERVGFESNTVPFDTVYTYDDPADHQLGVRPDEWQHRQYE